jgi:hypothetical protein
MAKFRITAPDGNTYEITAPDDASEDDVLAYAQQNYQSAPKAGNDFSDVQTRVTTGRGASVRQKPKIPRTQAELDAATGTNLDPSSGMSRFQQARAGFGKAFADTGRGINQTINAGQQVTVGLQSEAAKRLGLIDQRGQRAIINRVGVPLYERGLAMQAQESAQRELDAPLTSTGAGLAGNVAGYASQVIGPGIALRGTSAGAALLPRTVGGNALQGVALGAAQPVASEDERLLNAGVGGLAGGAGAALPAVAGGLARTMRYGRPSGVEKRAGKTLQEAMQGRPLNVEQSGVQGVNRTLGEASMDPGLMAIERNLRRADPGSFVDIDAANNAARVAALQNIAGDEASMAAAVQARETAAGPLYQAAGPKVAPMTPELMGALSRVPPRVLAKARGLARMDGTDFGEDATQLTGQQLHYIKLAVDDALSKTGPGGIGNVERRSLMGVKDALVNNISQSIPEYGQAMQAYAANSTPIGRMQIGQELLSRGRAAQDDILGNPLLQPGKFGRAARNLDYVAQSATGFNKAKPGDYLMPDDLKSISAINEDLRRISVRQANPAQPGSATYEAGALAKNMAQRGALQMAGRGAPLVGDMVKAYQQGMDDMAFKKLVFLVQNPQEAERVLKALPPAQRSALTQALMRLGSASASGAALSE